MNILKAFMKPKRANTANDDLDDKVNASFDNGSRSLDALHKALNELKKELESCNAGHHKADHRSR